MNVCTERIFSRRPASVWEEAYPIGNGSLGAMCYGSWPEETVFLNHDTLWSGRPDIRYPECRMKDVFPEVRKLVAEKKFSQATKLLGKNMGGSFCSAYLPAGALHFNFRGGVSGVQERTLDLADAVFTAETGTRESGRFFRTAFASHPDRMMVFRTKAEKPGALFCEIHFTSVLPGWSDSEGAADFFFVGQAPAQMRDIVGSRQYSPEGNPGLSYCMRCRVRLKGGRLILRRGYAAVEAADEMELRVSICTDYRDCFTAPENSGLDPQADSRSVLDAAEKYSFEELMERHTADYHALYNRSRLDFPPEESDFLPTEDRLQTVQKTKHVPPCLAALVYHFGRYLLISSSRPGMRPANLQGIWNHHLYAPWSSNYTTNINLEMNYWPAEPAALAECAEPVFQMILDASKLGRETAKELYGLPGWCMHHNSDDWVFTRPSSGSPQWGFWPFGGAWLCRHAADHYRYSGDKAFLKKHFPAMMSAAEFMLGFLVESENGLTTCPSTSPENAFYEPGTRERSFVHHGSQMDLSIIRDLFRSILELAPDAEEENNPILPRIRTALAGLRKPLIGDDGRLLEYGEPVEETEVTHRHLSHLYGFYPGNEFTEEETPEYFKACRKSLEARGLISTGWAMAWRAAMWTRFRCPDKVETILTEFLNPVYPNRVSDFFHGGVYISLLDAHPPFQIDGNFGVAAAMTEMFVQSHKRTPDGKVVVELYPSLLPSWKEGTMTGLRIQGGLTADFAWKDGTGRVSITAARGGSFVVRLPDGTRNEITLRAGEKTEWETKLA